MNKYRHTSTIPAGFGQTYTNAYRALIDNGSLLECPPQKKLVEHLSSFSNNFEKLLHNDKIIDRYKHVLNVTEARRITNERVNNNNRSTPPIGIDRNILLFSRIKDIFSGGKGFDIDQEQFNFVDEDVEDIPNERLSSDEKLRPLLSPLYIHGGVGQGKTALMNLWYDTVPLEEILLEDILYSENSIMIDDDSSLKENNYDESYQLRKMKVHFHEFLLRVQFAIYQARTGQNLYSTNGLPKFISEDPLMIVAWKLRREGVVLLSFDEFQVTNIGDAMILKQLFENLQHFGIQIITTSNRPPKDLYYQGLNRERFLPFIDMVEKYWDIFTINTDMDFRTVTLPSSKVSSLLKTPDPLPSHIVGEYWNYPARSRQKLEELVLSYFGKDNDSRTAVSIKLLGGRMMFVPVAVDDVAVCSFADLFENNVGTADYLGLCQKYSTLIVHSIPSLCDVDNLLAVIRRFITFIDIVYDNNAQCIFDSEEPLLRLFPMNPTIKVMDRFVKKIEDEIQISDDVAYRPPKLTLKAIESHLMTTLPINYYRLRGYLTNKYQFTESELEVLCKIFKDPTTLVKKEKNQNSEFNLDRIIGSILFHIKHAYTVEEKEFIYDLSHQEPLTPIIPYDVSNNEENKNATDDNKFAYVRTLSRLIELSNKSNKQ